MSARLPGPLALALVAALSVGLTGCNAGRNDTPVDPMEGRGSQDASGSGGQDLGPRPPGSHLTGKVVAPEGTLPISGALVYITSVPPAPIPDGVYCDKCVRLTEGTPYTTTRPDGTFDVFSVYSGEIASAKHVAANGAMLAAGFRKTGLLAQHLAGEKADKRGDAILWTRKTIASADADAA